MLQKTMVQCEGVARALDPQHNMWAAAAPVVEVWMKRELGPEGRIRDLGEDLSRLHEAMRQLPGAIEDWTEIGARLKTGELRLTPATNPHPWGLILAWLGAGALAGGRNDNRNANSRGTICAPARVLPYRRCNNQPDAQAQATSDGLCGCCPGHDV